MMHHTQRAALAAGKKAHDAGLCVVAANPYGRGTKSHWAFEQGFREAHREAGRQASPTGYITPRASWPRPATPTDMVPAWAGEFADFDDWINKATTRLTGTYDPMVGAEVPAICIDAQGRRCTVGGHFMRARDEGAFPVRFFWDCKPGAGPWSYDMAAAPDEPGLVSWVDIDGSTYVKECGSLRSWEAENAYAWRRLPPPAPVRGGV